MRDTLGHVTYALRRLRKSPGFTATAVVTLALGIGATTAIFTLVQQVMRQSLPVAKPEQLWRVGDVVRCCYSTGYSQANGSEQNDWTLFSWDAYKRFRADTPAFEDLAAFQIGTGNGELGVRRAGLAGVQARMGEYVSGNFFRTLGVSAWRGRVFTDADDVAGAPPVAVMSFHTWQEHYGADPSIVGAAFDLNGHAFTVIGVAPPGFFGVKVDAGTMPDMWLPLTTEPLVAGDTSRLENPGLAWLDLIGRARSGVNPASLEAQLQVELRQWLASHHAEMTAHERAVSDKQTLHLSPGGNGVSLMRENYADGLRLLLIAAICVLLLACANVANLLLAREWRNAHLTATRVAIGASPARVLREALIDGTVLAIAGGVAGIAVAYGGALLIVRLAFRNAWVPVTAAPSLAVLLFALGVSLVTALLFGSAPAWVASRADPMDAMRGRTRTASGTTRAQKLLVVAQAAMSIVLLTAAAMLGRSLYNLEHQNLGFAVDGRYLVSIDPKLSNYRQDQLLPLFRDIEARLRAIPGVRTASGVLGPPMRGLYWSHNLRISGHPEPGPQEDVSSAWIRVMPGFFETIGDRIVMGRPIVESDDASGRRVAVINEAFAKKFFPNENPIGQHFGPAAGGNPGLYEVVGVAADVRYFPFMLRSNEHPLYFLPEGQTAAFEDRELQSREIWSHYLYGIVIWAPGNPSGLAEAVRDRIAAAAPDLVIYSVDSYSNVIHRQFAQQDMIASLTWVFGAIGVVLAAVGLYGVTAYGVERRTSEIGVRMALGADRGSVLSMVLRGALAQVGAGLLAGIPAALLSGYLISSQLFGVSPWDPALLMRAIAVLTAAAVLAAFIPAWRAAGVDTMRTLRRE